MNKSFFMKPTTHRRGSALLMLVLALSLLVGVYSASTVQQSNQEREAEREQDAIALLENAIDAVNELRSRETTFFRLPVDESKDHWIEIVRSEKDAVNQVHIAKLICNGSEVLTIQRKQRSPK